MKKNVFEMVVAMVNGCYVADMDTLRNEINAEYERMNAKRQANKDAYEQAKPIVFAAIADTALTVKDIFTACEDELPEGFTSHKIQYGLLHYWNDEVVKIDNGKGPFTYKVK